MGIESFLPVYSRLMRMSEDIGEQELDKFSALSFDLDRELAALTAAADNVLPDQNEEQADAC